MERIRYIDGDKDKGIKYNYAKITKLYKSLGVPAEYDFSDIIPIGEPDLHWYNLNSERSVGKTTNLLLYGMCMNVMYGTQIQLIRNHIDKASYYETLFNAIVNYNNSQYILRLSDGEYNGVRYYQKRFFLTRYNENGKEEARSETPFCISLSADDCYALCSKYEAPRGDWIILDECFNDRNTPDEFLHFIHLHKTIVRERMSDKIFILGNTLDINNIWYRQLTIQNEVRKLKYGEHKIVYTSEGMPIYVHFLSNRAPEKRKKFNSAHYGFDNPELNAIKGNGSWNVKMYPQTCELEDREIIQRGIYFSYHDDMFMEMSFIDTRSGMFLEVHPATYIGARDGDIVYTLHFPVEPNQCYFGMDRLSQTIMRYIRSKRIVFNDNETGDLFEKFCSECTNFRI